MKRGLVTSFLHYYSTVISESVVYGSTISSAMSASVYSYGNWAKATGWLNTISLGIGICLHHALILDGSCLIPLEITARDEPDYF